MRVGRFSEEKDTLRSVQERFEQWRKRQEAAAVLTGRHTYQEVSTMEFGD